MYHSEPTDILSTQDTKVNVLLEILGQVKVNDIMGGVFIELFQVELLHSIYKYYITLSFCSAPIQNNEIGEILTI